MTPTGVYPRQPTDPAGRLRGRFFQDDESGEQKHPQGLHDIWQQERLSLFRSVSTTKCGLGTCEIGSMKLKFCLELATLSFVTLGRTVSVLSLIFFSCEMVVTVLRCQLLKITDVKRAWCVLVCVTSTEMIVKLAQVEYWNVDKTVQNSQSKAYELWVNKTDTKEKSGRDWMASLTQWSWVWASSRRW